METISDNDLNSLKISKSICIGSLKLENKDITSFSLSSSILKLNETKFLLKEGEYIQEGIKVKRFLFETSLAKFFLANVEEVNIDILIKSSPMKITKENIDAIDLVTETFQKTIHLLNHVNVISYYVIDVSYNEVKDAMDINTMMEYFKGISLSQYLYNFNKKNRVVKGLPIHKIKTITRGVVSGLVYLHSKKITHSELNPSNILVNEEDESKVKIINHSLRLRKDNIQKNPYYSSPELAFQKTMNNKTDIWSLGSIVFELFTGRKTYSNETPNNALCLLVKQINPIEASDDKIKDILYAKANRSLLNFLLQCFRGDNFIRPEAEELLQHKFLS